MPIFNCVGLQIRRNVVANFSILNFQLKGIKAVIAAGVHLFPSRTEKLSPLAPMVLHHNVGE